MSNILIGNALQVLHCEWVYSGSIVLDAADLQEDIVLLAEGTPSADRPQVLS